MRGRAAAEEQRVNFPRMAKRGQLRLQRRQVTFDQIIPPGGYGEVAVPAAMDAERHVNVGGARIGHGKSNVGRERFGR